MWRRVLVYPSGNTEEIPTLTTFAAWVKVESIPGATQYFRVCHVAPHPSTVCWYELVPTPPPVRAHGDY